MPIADSRLRKDVALAVYCVRLSTGSLARLNSCFLSRLFLAKPLAAYSFATASQASSAVSEEDTVLWCLCCHVLSEPERHCSPE